MTCVVSGAGTVRGCEASALPGAGAEAPLAGLAAPVEEGGAIRPGFVVSALVATWLVLTPAGPFGFLAQRDIKIWSPIKTAMIRKIARRVLRSMESAPA